MRGTETKVSQTCQDFWNIILLESLIEYYNTINQFNQAVDGSLSFKHQLLWIVLSCRTICVLTGSFRTISVLTGWERGVGTTILVLLSDLDLHQRKRPVKAAPTSSVSKFLYWVTRSCTSGSDLILLLSKVKYQGNIILGQCIEEKLTSLLPYVTANSFP